MTTTREAGAPPTPGPVPPGERSMVTRIQGLRWWATVLLALVLTALGVSVDILRSGQLGLFYMIFFPAGCLLAIVWVRRAEMFGPLVQPPLLVAVAVPAVVIASGSLPRTGGLTSSALAIGGPLINGFPTMAITTAGCLAIGFIRWRLQPLGGGDRDDARPPRPSGQSSSARPSGQQGSASGRDRPRGERERAGRDDRGRDDRGRDGRAVRDDRDRSPRPGQKAAGVYRVSSSGETDRAERGRRPDPPRR